MYVFLFNTLLLLTIAHIKVAVTMILLLFLYLLLFTNLRLFSRAVYDVCRGQLLEYCETLNYVLKRS